MQTRQPATTGRFFAALMAIQAIVLLWSAINPHDYFTWFLEVVPVLIAAPLLVWWWPRFRFTPMVYALLAVHGVILMVGGHFTYAEVPYFDWLWDAMGASRNHYDRIGHFAQGFVPAMVLRELLLRTSTLRGFWLPFLTICFCLAFSALYELIEWWTAAAMGESADSFLGSQGDIWDAQKDMMLALTGATLALLTLSRAHDRALRGVV